MLLVLSFVYFTHVTFCPFSFALGGRGWLRLVLVALPGPFYMLFVAKGSLPQTYRPNTNSYDIGLEPIYQKGGDIYRRQMVVRIQYNHANIHQKQRSYLYKLKISVFA